MKKLISLTLALIICLTSFSVLAFAADTEVTGVVLNEAKYYEAVKTADEIKDAVIYVDFEATFNNGTKANYNTKDGWDDESVTAEVAWTVKEENDENFGYQQSLYVTIDGTEHWLGYVNVEVNKFKAVMRNIITLNGATCEQKVTYFAEIFRFLEYLFDTLDRELGKSDAFPKLRDAFGGVADMIDKIRETVFTTDTEPSTGTATDAENA